MFLRVHLIVAAVLALVAPGPARAFYDYRVEVDTFITAEYELRCTLVGGPSGGKTITFRQMGHHNFTLEADSFTCALTGYSPYNLTVRIFEDGYVAARKYLILPFRTFDFSYPGD